MSAVQLGILLNGGHLSTGLAKLLEQFFANVGMCHFTGRESGPSP